MKILMVCLGNICRSPIAHGIMQRLVDEKGLDWEINSAGTGNWHVGECPDKRAIATAQSFGTDISTQRAEHFTADHFDRFDIIFAMDKSNLRNITALAKSDSHREKVRLFLGEGEVPDPYYDDGMFERVYKMVERRCEQLIDEIIAETK